MTPIIMVRVTAVFKFKAVAFMSIEIPALNNFKSKV